MFGFGGGGELRAEGGELTIEPIADPASVEPDVRLTAASGDEHPLDGARQGIEATLGEGRGR